MIFLHALGDFHPHNVLSNAFLESLDIGVDCKWIADRVGIDQRRTVLPLDYIRETRNRDPRAASECATHSNKDTAVQASRQAFARAGLQPSDIGMVIVGGCSPESSLPAEACQVAEALGIDAPAFDLNAGCTSFVAQLHFLSQWDPSALPDFVLLVCPENNTRTVDYTDRSVAVIWGDGSTAAIVSSRVVSSHIISNTRFGSDPTGSSLIRTPAGGHFRQKGNIVQAFAIRKTSELFQVGRAACVGNGVPTYYVGHQANLRMLEAACRRAEVQPQEHLSCVKEYGNCGAAGAPSVLSQRWDDLVAGSRIVLAVVGAGLCWASAQIEFRGSHESYHA